MRITVVKDFPIAPRVRRRCCSHQSGRKAAYTLCAVLPDRRKVMVLASDSPSAGARGDERGHASEPGFRACRPVVMDSWCAGRVDKCLPMMWGAA